jgi:hypothetical protein
MLQKSPEVHNDLMPIEELRQLLRDGIEIDYDRFTRRIDVSAVNWKSRGIPPSEPLYTIPGNGPIHRACRWEGVETFEVSPDGCDTIDIEVCLLFERGTK